MSKRSMKHERAVYLALLFAFIFKLQLVKSKAGIINV